MPVAGRAKPRVLRPRSSIRERLLGNSRTTRSGCREYTGTIGKNGYGVFFVNNLVGTKPAHRVAYEEFVGSIPEGMQVDHECHNRSRCDLGARCRHRRCIEPTHLSLKTPSENVLSGKGWMRLGEAQAAKSVCPKGHLYEGDNLYIRPSTGGRECRQCRRDYSRGYKRAARRRDGKVLKTARRRTSQGKYMKEGG